MRGWRKNRSDPSPAETYLGLRRGVLDLDPAAVGIAASAQLPQVWGLLVDLGRPDGVATLLGLADGTTSLYVSAGGGIIGGGGHPRVAARTLELLRVTQRLLPELPAATGAEAPGVALPAAGRVTLHALTYGGVHSVEADENDLGHGRHPLSPVFHAAHDVITELRLIDEARGT